MSTTKSVLRFRLLLRQEVTNFDEDVDDLALNVDHIFEADQCDAFNSDVNRLPPTTQNHFSWVYKVEDTRDMAEITRKRMMEKMKSPLCVENKVRFALPDLLEETFLQPLASTKNSDLRIDNFGP
ncbi:hypothetical protein Tco_0457917 [Tanacetum coccineum]